MNSKDRHDRVRKNTSQSVNRQIDQDIAHRVDQYAGKTSVEISLRIQELEREWDVERVLEMNASALAFSGLVMGVVHDRKWLVIPGIVLPFLFQHAVQGWCPPLPALRRLGVRTREEIDREKYALKALRGDFEQVTGPHEAERASR
jgi:hypothetical protein